MLPSQSGFVAALSDCGCCAVPVCRWRMPTELAIDLAALALYDIVIYGDDSGSM